METGEGDLDTETQRRHRKEGRVKTQAEIGVMQLKPRNIKDCQESPEARRRQGRSLP